MGSNLNEIVYRVFLSTKKIPVITTGTFLDQDHFEEYVKSVILDGSFLKVELLETKIIKSYTKEDFK